MIHVKNLTLGIKGSIRASEGQWLPGNSCQLPHNLALSVIMVPITGLWHLMIDWCGKKIIVPSYLSIRKINKTKLNGWWTFQNHHWALPNYALCLLFQREILFVLISLLIFMLFLKAHFHFYITEQSLLSESMFGNHFDKADFYGPQLNHNIRV